MIQTPYANYYHTQDGEKLYYCTNFSDVSKIRQPVLVFNYGLICNNGHWSKQIPYFDQIKYPILIHNYRGHFNSTGSQHIEKCTFKQFSLDLKEILDELAIKSTIMLGHSMGVNVTLEFAKSFPEMVEKMILISGTVFSPKDIMFDTNLTDLLIPYAKLFKDKFPNIFQKFWAHGGKNTLIQKMIMNGGFNKSQVPMEFVEIYLNRIGQLDPELFFQLLDEMGSHDIITHLENILQPALLISGDSDKVIPNYLQFAIKDRLKNSEIYIIKNGSHVPQVDFPDIINERISHFINA